MPGAMSADLAEVLSDTDEGYTQAEETMIEYQTDELIAECIADPNRFFDLMEGIDHMISVYPQLHRALMNLRSKDQYSTEAICSALWEIDRRVQDEAEILFRKDCRKEAEEQIKVKKPF